MPHDHAHDHAAAGNPPARAFAIGLAINLAFVIAEVVFGVTSRSMALLADAGHNLGDVLGLGLAGGAAMMAARRPSARRTYRLRRSTILASLTNAVVLLVVTGGIVWESILRLRHPDKVSEKIVISVAIAGVVVNAGSALLFLRDRKRDLNVASAFAHLAADAVLAFGVALAGAVILWTWANRSSSISATI